MKILDELEKNGFFMGRMITGSKSFYMQKYPGHDVYFNANIIMEEYGKIWYGDLDLTIDFDKLYDIAKNNNVTLYILRELDARFSNENSPFETLIKKAVCKIN